jgi:hypothetical protein
MIGNDNKTRLGAKKIENEHFQHNLSFKTEK